MSRLRYLTAGESHGPGLTAMLEGCPAGLAVDPGAIDAELRRRQSGYGRGERQSIEQDRVRILGGVRHGRTTGAPIALFIAEPRRRQLGDALAVGGARERACAAGARRRAAAGARRPRRGAALRPGRHPRRDRARERPGDRGEGRLRGRRQGPARRAGLRGRQPRGRHRRCHGRVRHEPRRRRPRRGEPGALPRRGGGPPDDRRHRRRVERRRHARRRGRGARLRVSARRRQLRAG